MHRCAWRGTEVQATRSPVPVACRGNVAALGAMALEAALTVLRATPAGEVPIPPASASRSPGRWSLS